MPNRAANEAGFAFLTVTSHIEQGHSGGLLVLNANGRPLEFHCTAAIKPTKAQEILFGPTLREYLFGEQIAATLVEKTSSQISLVLTDCTDCHSLRALIDVPLIYVHDTEAEADTHPSNRGEQAGTDAPIGSQQSWRRFSHEGYQLSVCDRDRRDEQEFCTRIADASDHLDLIEPFARVHEAIAEALSPGRAA